MPLPPRRPTPATLRRLLARLSPLLVGAAVFALLVVTGVVPHSLVTELSASVQWFAQEAVFPVVGAVVALLVYRLAS